MSVTTRTRLAFVALGLLLALPPTGAQSGTFPDLATEDVVFPATMEASASITFTAVVRNLGYVAAGPFDVLFAVDGASIGTTRVQYLMSGEATNVQSPAWRATPGNHTLLAYANSGGTVPEGDYSNNGRTEGFHVAAPDLVATAFWTTPADPIVDDDVTFRATIANAGDAPSGSSYVLFTQRNNATGGTSQYVGTLPGLAAGASVTVVANVVWPGFEGNYTMTVEPDYIHQVAESNESNVATFSFRVTQPRPGMGPDLTVRDLDIGSMVAGTTVAFTARVRNLGNASASAFHVRFEVDGALLGEVSVSKLRQSTETSVTSPKWNATQGTHTFTAIADSRAAVAEFNESNNARTESATVAAKGPDLRIASLGPASVREGDVVRFEAVVENQGNEPAALFYTRFTLDGATLGGDVLTTALAPGANTTVTATTTWTATLGWHNATVATDVTSAVSESDETNNGATMAFNATERNPPADLVVLDAWVQPGEPVYGDTLSYYATVANLGPGSATNTLVGFYTSSPGTMTTLALQGVPALAPGANATVVFEFGTPTTKTGNFTVRTMADYDARVRETNESNNLTFAYSVTAPRPGMAPDLVVTSAYTSASPKAGTTISLNARVKNQGNATANGTVARFLVDGQVVGNQTLGTIYQGVTLSASVNWVAKQGTHTLTVLADPDDAVDELNESNNALTVTFTVASNGPELYADAPTVNLAPYDARTFTVTVRNQGDKAATPFVVRFLVDGYAVGADKAVGTLGANGGSIVLTSDAWTATPGDHVVTVLVDAANSVAESDETNNERSEAFTVTG